MTRDDFDWIEAWLDDSLSAEERQTFAARLEAEPALRAAMREQQEAVVAFRMLEKEQAREQLKAQWQEVKKEQNVRPAKVRPMTSPWLWLGAAAAIVLILLLVFRPDAKPQTP